MEWQPAPRAWIWIDKPDVMVVAASLQPLPERWLNAFRLRSKGLPCLGTTQSGSPCKRHVYEWRMFLYGISAPFAEYCTTHRGPEHPAMWGFWRMSERIPCPCGCGARVTVEGSALTKTPKVTHHLWKQVLATLGPVQWVDPVSTWTALLAEDGRVGVASGIEDVSESTEYRDWLFDGPASPWDDLPDDAPESEPLT